MPEKTILPGDRTRRLHAGFLLTEKGATWLFAGVLLAFVLLKIPHLSIPFFWDESGVYGRMIFLLADNGLSMDPTAIDMWISRGHPLLYPNLIAGVCILFGDTVTAAHGANFLIACGLLVSIFFCLKHAFNGWIGLMTCVLMMATPNFYAQSVFVLPEIALTFFLWWTTWAFIKKQYLLYMLAGSAAVLTKEPAIIWVGALFAWDFFQLHKLKTWKVFLWLVPLVVFALFLYWQKEKLGWYFFPYHTGGFDFTPMVIWEKAGDYLTYLFNREGRVIWLAVLIVAFLGLILKKTGSSQLSLMPIPVRYHALFFATLLYLLFSSTTFYHLRYILPLYPPLCFLIAYLAYHFVVFKKKSFALIFLAITTYVSFTHHSADTFNYDNDMSYLRSVASTQKTVAYMYQNQMTDHGAFFATMPVDYALLDWRFGYMPPGSEMKYTVPVHQGTKYVIQVIPGTRIENPHNFPLELMDTWKDHDIITNIYKVLPPE